MSETPETADPFSISEFRLCGPQCEAPRLNDREQAEDKSRRADALARLGTTGQLLFCMDPGDAVNLHRRTFLCRMRTLSALEFAVWQRVNAAFDLLEIIA